MSLTNLKNLSKVKLSTWLLIILVIGLLLRVNNLTIGFPILYASGDEAVYHLSALNMLASKTLFTLGNYGPLGAYLQIPFIALASFVLFITSKIHSISDLEFLIVTHEGYFLFIPRVISALFGTLTIIAAYSLSKELFKKKEIALLSSLLTALSFNLVFISHQARPWSPAVFFTVVVALWTVKAIRNEKKFTNYFIISCILSSVSFGFHQFGGLSVLLILFIFFCSGLSFKKHKKGIILGLIVFILIVLMLNFLSLGSGIFQILNPADKSDPVELFKFNFLEKTFFKDVRHFFFNSFLSDPLIFIFFAVFAVTCFNKKGVFRAFLLFFLVNLIALLLFFPLFMRYLLVSFCFLPILAGYAFFRIISLDRYRLLFLGASVFVIVLNLVYFSMIILNETTFNQSRQWLDKSLDRRVPIVATTHRYFGYTPSVEAIKFVSAKNSNYYAKASSLLGEKYPENVRFIIYANSLATPGESKSSYTMKAASLVNAGYIIDSYTSLGDRLWETNGFNYQLLAHFSSTGDIIYNEVIPEALFDTTQIFPYFRLKRPGTYIDILRVE